MKNWFPLTDYEFYAFLTAGMIVIASVDFAFCGSSLLSRSSWTVASGVFWIAAAYLTGQLTAGPSSSFSEHLAGKRIFRTPGDVLLGFTAPRRRERILCALSGAREYQAFPTAIANSITSKASLLLGAEPITDAETAFQVAFPRARRSVDTAKRLDNFGNVYGMCRNVSFAALIATAVLMTGAVLHDDAKSAWCGLGAFVLALGMFGRFMKFYAAYSREVFRTFNSELP